MVRTSSLLAAALLVASPLAGQEDAIWTSKRPDGHAPLGVIGGRVLGAREVEVTYRFTKIQNKGVFFQEDSISTETALETYPVVPTDLNNLTHTFGLALGITDDVTLLANLDYSERERRQVTADGLFFTTRTQDLGDLEVAGLFRFLADGPYTAHLQAGFIAPTGEERPRDETPFSGEGKEALPYDMRAGRGVWAIRPGLTAQVQNDVGSVGAQVKGTIHVGTNDAGFTPGDRVEGTAWAAYRVNSFFSLSGRFLYENWDRIEGADPELDPLRDPGNDAFFMDGTRVDIPIGINFYLPEGSRFAGNRIAIEFRKTVHRDFGGPQLSPDDAFVVGWQVVF